MPRIHPLDPPPPPDCMELDARVHPWGKSGCWSGTWTRGEAGAHEAPGRARESLRQSAALGRAEPRRGCDRKGVRAAPRQQEQGAVQKTAR
eukprot:12175797-Alexandrium_andersonii.AAC.1